MKAKRSRLDVFLVEQGLCASREQAQRAVMAGEVRIGDAIVNKSSVMVEPGAAVSLRAPPPYVGRGGTKLEGALDHFAIQVQGLTALDIGASTGGFTDCLLQRGAAKVYAIDVGHGQLAWKIRNDPRVVVHEKVNARYLRREDIPERIDLCVIDVSFISLTLILPNAFDLVTPHGVILALIKPQFELQAAEVAHGGIVRDPSLHEKAQNKIRDFVANAGHTVTGLAPSGITGADGRPGILYMRPQKIGLIAHTAKPGVAELTRALCQEFEHHKLPVLLEAKTAALAGLSSDWSVTDLGRQSDLLVVLGGDGTILHVVEQLTEVIKPVFGINVGSLGFLTCANSSTYSEAVECIAAGKMVFSNRTLLEVTVRVDGKDPTVMTGLNDVVFSRGEVSRLIRLKTRVNGEALTEFNADGLIVATPTGSTAYSLSAGGPILAPESGAFVITPICPHVLTNRSIIVGESATIEVEVTEREYPVFLTVDGREPLHIEAGAIVEVRKSQRMLPLASLPGVSFFGVVRQKLKWSGSNI